MYRGSVHSNGSLVDQLLCRFHYIGAIIEPISEIFRSCSLKMLDCQDSVHVVWLYSICMLITFIYFLSIHLHRTHSIREDGDVERAMTMATHTHRYDHVMYRFTQTSFFLCSFYSPCDCELYV